MTKDSTALAARNAHAANVAARIIKPSSSDGERIYASFAHQGNVIPYAGSITWRERHPDFQQSCAQAAAEFAKPYIDELESTKAELTALRDVASKIMAIHDALPTWPSRGDCATAINELAPHVQQLSAIMAESRGAT
jgi:hypothetical protein